MASLSSSNEEAPSMSVQESRRQSIQRCIQSLGHACQCYYDICPLPACQKMKRVVQHARGCKGKTNGSCPVCKQVIALCAYHAKHCQEDTCPVPFCFTIKNQIQHQRQQAQLGHPMAVQQQPLLSPAPGMPMQQPSTSQTPQPNMYPQLVPSPTPANPGMPMEQPSTSQPNMYPQLLPSPTPANPGMPMEQPSTSQTPQPNMYPQLLPSPTPANPGMPMEQPSTSQTPQPNMYPQLLPSPTPANPGMPMEPSTSQTPQPNMYPRLLPSPATSGIPMQQPSTLQPAPQPSPRGAASPGFPNVAGIQSHGKSASFLPVVPPEQPPPVTFADFNQLEPEEEQIYWDNIEDEISVNPTVGPVNPLVQMSMNVPHPGSITSSIMQSMQPGHWYTAPMPQQSSIQQNIQRPVIERTAALQAVVEPQLQGVFQQQACNISPNALQDLLQTLKAPSSPQQQQQVLNILKSNPQLMAAFIKQRTAKYLSGMQPQQAPQQPGMYPQPVPSPSPAISMQVPNIPQFLQPVRHPSPGGMASLGSPNEDETPSINPQESRRLSIRRHIQSLEHAYQCRNCSLPSCQKIKKVMRHFNGCQHKPGCSVCRNLIALCCNHAKQCQENTCPVLFCLNIKHKLRQQQIQRRLQQVQLMRRRMATMNTRTQGRTKG